MLSLLKPKSSQTSKVPQYAGDLSPKDAWDFLKRTETAQLIDVRTEAEWRFVGTPVLRSLSKTVQFVEWVDFTGTENTDFVPRVTKLFPEFGTPLLFLCRSGGRSLAAAKAMTAAGYSQCYNVQEGFEGDLNHEHHRNKKGGWRFHELPWAQN